MSTSPVRCTFCGTGSGVPVEREGEQGCCGEVHALLHREGDRYNSGGTESHSERVREQPGTKTVPHYWCETCQLMISEKRCTGCGLKAVKKR